MTVTSSMENKVSCILRHNRGPEKRLRGKKPRNLRKIIEYIMDERQRRRIIVMCSGPE